VCERGFARPVALRECCLVFLISFNRKLPTLLVLGSISNHVHIFYPTFSPPPFRSSLPIFIVLPFQDRPPLTISTLTRSLSLTQRLPVGLLRAHCYFTNKQYILRRQFDLRFVPVRKSIEVKRATRSASTRGVVGPGKAPPEFQRIALRNCRDKYNCVAEVSVNPEGDSGNTR